VDTPTFQPNVLSSMWRYRWLVLASVVGLAALGFLYGINRPPEYVATATMVVEDPRAASLFEAPSGRPERYVIDQMAILESAAVAERAAALAAEQLPSVELEPEHFLANVEVSGRPDSDVIEISFRAPDPNTAQLGANALVAAYQEVRRSEAANNAAAALERLDASLEAIDEELVSIRARISAALAQEDFRDELDRQMAEAVTRLLDLWNERATTTSSIRLAEIDLELEQVGEQLQTLGLVQGLRQQDPEQAALLQEQQAALGRRAQLETRRDQMAVDAELTSSGVVVLSPALLPGEPSGPGLLRILAVALVLGVLVGAGLAYLLAQRTRTFADRSEPELVLAAPLLAEVPIFSDEGIKSPLPVRTARLSAAAEAFRFAAAAIDIQGANISSLMAVSPTLGDGKTTVVANTAMAAAREGNRVLVVDADFGDQALSRLLLGEVEARRGLTELVEMGLDPSDVLEVISLGEDASLGLIGRGRLPVTAANFFRSAGAQDFFTKVRQQFDLVLIDAPPLLQVAYASTVARYADAALVVVAHEGDVQELQELAARLAFIGTPTAGYIYNFAPLRPEMIASQGSLRNILGAEPEPELVGRQGARHKG
jgi:Mrp family chromosome partitioning ATPase/uncharacterized protein involved in exopolysaccharide biosynthesis